MTVDIYDALAEAGFYGGRMLAGDKSSYNQRYPENTVYFNACVFNEHEQQVWHGDVDLDRDAPKLQEAADACGQTFYVTPEHPFRFGGWRGGEGGMARQDKSDRERIVRFDPST